MASTGYKRVFQEEPVIVSPSPNCLYITIVRYTRKPYSSYRGIKRIYDWGFGPGQKLFLVFMLVDSAPVLSLGFRV